MIRMSTANTAKHHRHLSTISCSASLLASSAKFLWIVPHYQNLQSSLKEIKIAVPSQLPTKYCNISHTVLQNLAKSGPM